MLMKRKALAATLILALLISIIVGMQPVNVAVANFTPLPPDLPHIYIRSDGSVHPLTAPIQKVGDTYTFTSDIIDYTIEVQRNNIIIDGAGFTITQTPIDTSQLMTPAGWHPAIDLTSRSNVTVKNTEFTHCISGINLESSSSITITQNNITNSGDIAIFICSSSDCTIAKNDITRNHQGMLIIDSKHIDILENNITRNSVGIQCYASKLPPKLVPGATSSCAYVDIIGNNIKENYVNGIVLHASFFNRIEYNTLANNNEGIGLFPSYYTIIYHNNFISNSQNVDAAGVAYAGGGYTWIWDSGSEGNYWSDYLTRYPNASEINTSGIGDTPYVIDANNIDHYPLMSEVPTNPPYAILEFPSPLPTPPPSPTPSPSPLPSPSPSPSPSPTATPTNPESFPTTLVAVASGASAAIIGIGLLVYFKKRKH
jgi:parallel beta-helix repeat protein